MDLAYPFSLLKSISYFCQNFSMTSEQLKDLKVRVAALRRYL